LTPLSINFTFRKKCFLIIRSDNFPPILNNKFSPKIFYLINEQELKCEENEDIKGSLQQECLIYLKKKFPKYLYLKYRLVNSSLAKKIINTLKIIDNAETLFISLGLPEAPLHSAVYDNDLNKAHSLLSEGADINVLAKNQFSPLHYAVKDGTSEFIDLLIKKGADVNSIGHQFHNAGTPLHLVCMNRKINHTPVFKTLIKYGAKLNIKDSNGATAFLYSVEFCSKEAILVLIKNGANIFVKDFDGNTALHYVAQRSPLGRMAKNRIPIAKMLIDMGLDVNIENVEGFTPLDLARQIKDTKMVEALTKFGAKHP